jgi:SAM-dependent methyltransferase
VNEAFYIQTSRVEDEHWWFAARRRLLHGLLSAEPPPPSGGRALDVGCGSGGNLDLLARHCAHVVGLDLSPLALRLARQKRPRALLVQGDANRMADLFSPESHDLIALLNVLYHRWVTSESEVLDQAADLLRPGGRLLITEPAFRVLFRWHDRVDWGRKRYRLSELRRLVAGAGLRVVRSSYFNSIAFLPALAVALLDRATGRLDRSPGGDGEVGEIRIPHPALNRALATLLTLEARWIRTVGALPVGVGAVLLARKPERGGAG